MFAAIDIGSYELEMKIFEMSQKYGMRQIDDVRHQLDLGKGYLSYRKAEL